MLADPARLVMAAAAVVAPVPPLSISSVPPSVIVPEPVTGPPEVVRPVVPPDTPTLVTVPLLPVAFRVLSVIDKLVPSVIS